MLPGQGQTVQQTGRRELVERLAREELAIAEEQGRQGGCALMGGKPA